MEVGLAGLMALEGGVAGGDRSPCRCHPPGAGKPDATRRARWPIGRTTKTSDAHCAVAGDEPIEGTPRQ
jgi:hypothetical protein